MNQSNMKTAYRKWIAKKLQQLREKSGMSQNEVADKVNLQKQTYKTYEAGRSAPSLLVIKQLCTLYQITVDNFLEDSPLPDVGYKL